MPSVLVTGGAGYIGSHTCIALDQAGYDVHVVDSWINAHRSVAERIRKLASRPISFSTLDIRDRQGLETLMASQPFDAVIHFAALKAVSTSVLSPLEYVDVNVGGTLSLLQAMQSCQIRKFIFSSSATVYGCTPAPFREDQPVSPINPYGQTKVVVEDMLDAVANSAAPLHSMSLRYFNPVGAHPSGLIGENPRETPSNLFPVIAQVVSGLREQLTIFGHDYDTPDGTCIRDYVHVCDVAEGHVRALEAVLGPASRPSHERINLGTGKGYSVREIVNAWEAAAKRAIPYTLVERRPGDASRAIACVQLAHERLKWQARHDLPTMCADHLRWVLANETQNSASTRTEHEPA